MTQLLSKRRAQAAEAAEFNMERFGFMGWWS